MRWFTGNPQLPTIMDSAHHSCKPWWLLNEVPMWSAHLRTFISPIKQPCGSLSRAWGVSGVGETLIGLKSILQQLSSSHITCGRHGIRQPLGLQRSRWRKRADHSSPHLPYTVEDGFQIWTPFRKWPKLTVVILKWHLLQWWGCTVSFVSEGCAAKHLLPEGVL